MHFRGIQSCLRRDIIKPMSSLLWRRVVLYHGSMLPPSSTWRWRQHGLLQ